MKNIIWQQPDGSLSVWSVSEEDDSQAKAAELRDASQVDAAWVAVGFDVATFPDAVQHSWRWLNGAIVVDEVLLAPTVEERRTAINLQRDAALVAGVEYNGKLFHTDDRFLVELLGMVLGYQAGVFTGTQKIRTRDNEILDLNQGEIVALANAVGAYRKAVYATSWAAKDAL